MRLNLRIRTSYGIPSGAYVDYFLFKSHVHSLDTVIVVVGMFIQNYLNFDRKKLSCRRLVPVFQPSVIARFADLQHTAHCFDFVLFRICEYKMMSFTALYFFRSFAKKPSASFKILFASRNSAFSLSSSRFLMRSSSSLIVTVSFGLCLLWLRQSASV